MLTRKLCRTASQFVPHQCVVRNNITFPNNQLNTRGIPVKTIRADRVIRRRFYQIHTKVARPFRCVTARNRRTQGIIYCIRKFYRSIRTIRLFGKGNRIVIPSHRLMCDFFFHRTDFAAEVYGCVFVFNQFR